MKDKDLVNMVLLMQRMEENIRKEEQLSKTLAENTEYINGVFSRVSESLNDEFDDLIQEDDATMSTVSSGITKSLKGAFSGMGSWALGKLDKMADKINPTGLEDGVVRDVLTSYTDELRVLKNKHEAALSIFSTSFWDDIFEMLGISGQKTEAEFLRTHRANLIELRNEAAERKSKITNAIKEIQVEENGKRVHLVAKYKNMSAIMASKYRDVVLKNDNVKAAMKEYKSFVANAFKKSFMALFSSLVQVMTIQYIATKNKNMSNKGDKKESVEVKCRFQLFEEQHLILKEYDSK